jgi:hypothetical protein
VRVRYRGGVDPFDPGELHIHKKNLNIGVELAKGAFGTVYKGSLDGENIAVKMETIEDYSQEELVNLSCELTFLQSCAHDQVVRFLGAGYLAEPNNKTKVGQGERRQ